MSVLQSLTLQAAPPAVLEDAAWLGHWLSLWQLWLQLQQSISSQQLSIPSDSIKKSCVTHEADWNVTLQAL